MNDIEFETLKNLLKVGTVEVTFTKKNGETRVMNCTLESSYLPEMVNESTKKSNDEVASVWDLDNNGWRSFRYDSVVSYIIGGSYVQKED
jgi:hypothetical protein